MIPTCNQIELFVYNTICTKANILVPNVSWGLLSHEADLVMLKPSGYLSEFEIKRSWADFKADFKKKHDHTDPLIKDFYYVLHESFSERAINYIEENDVKCTGVYIYNEGGIEPVLYKCGAKYPKGRKLTGEEERQMLRLGMFRIWKLKQKLIDNH